MDRLQAMQVYTRIVELRAFGKAADSLQLPRASVTQLIQQLETHLGVQLLRRTTRQVSVTADGQAYYERCVRLLEDLEEAENCFSDSPDNPRGKLRIDLPSSLGRLVVIPALPEFCRRYPQIELELSLNDRQVDLVREGVDCVLRAGELPDSSLVGRRIAELEQLTCVGRAYAQEFGLPEHPQRLEGHLAVNYQSASSGRIFDLEFRFDGQLRTQRLPSRITVNNADAYIAACRAGFGMIQAPRYHLREGLASGELLEVLRAWQPPPLPVSVLYPVRRQMSRRLRVFSDWLGGLFEAGIV
ncbi:LysR family transcriptional regulator [Pseudomonas nitroreducens]|uniref:LysR family transcriptional regulator n=1 Tax=Pseudomonas nitroreducens TaxID=46680 RepID=UPI000A06F46A|nr:LysR family transcriptional regulator [Pseudomonas nitroreducens]NMZ58656.1 LysR family transcriptional regulator [Pseudomonas nitroreducens]SNS62263.1 DNA-binding transcriptional regulator, LysR family [Pseudomonas nitroreducens]